MAHYFLAVPHTDEKGWDTPDHLILRATFKVEERRVSCTRDGGRGRRPLLPFFSSPVISSHVPSRASCRVKACVTAVSADDALSHPRENSQRLARRFAGIVTIWDWLREEQFRTRTDRYAVANECAYSPVRNINLPLCAHKSPWLINCSSLILLNRLQGDALRTITRTCIIFPK